jgi:hypothetical protein
MPTLSLLAYMLSNTSYSILPHKGADAQSAKASTASSRSPKLAAMKTGELKLESSKSIENIGSEQGITKIVLFP